MAEQYMTVSFTLPSGMVERLDSVAKVRDQKRSALVRDLLGESLDRVELAAQVAALQAEVERLRVKVEGE